MKNKIQKIKDKLKNSERGKGLQGRWLRNTVGIILALVLVCTIVLSCAIHASYYADLEEDMVVQAGLVTQHLVLNGSQEVELLPRAGAELMRTYLKEGRDMGVQFVDTSYEIVACAGFGDNPELRGAAGTEASGEDISKAFQDNTLAVYTGNRTVAVSVPIYGDNDETVGVLRFISGTEHINRRVFHFAITATLVGLLLLTIVYVSGRYYVKSILGPVSEITATAKRIAAGGYGVQIKTRFDDEIGELANTINDMSNNLAQSEKTQSEFMSSVSHELRTPLTAISGWSETLLDAGGSVEAAEARRGLNIILRESRRLTSMVEELLEFSRMQDGRFKLNVTMGDIRSEFEDTVFMYGSRLQQEEIKLEYLENDDEIPEIPCDTSRMRQVFLNILDNGAKHGGDGGKITAEIRLEDETVVIRIRDFGPGIPQEELPLIKKKFYKGSSKARGSGIGLAVCEEIVTMHGGDLDISNAEGGGTLVTIRLPVGEK